MGGQVGGGDGAVGEGVGQTGEDLLGVEMPSDAAGGTARTAAAMRLGRPIQRGVQIGGVGRWGARGEGAGDAVELMGGDAQFMIEIGTRGVGLPAVGIGF